MRYRFSILQRLLILAVVPVVLYVTAMIFFVLPRVDNAVKTIEEENAKAVLEKVAVLVENAGEDLKRYRKDAIERHKHELKSVTDIVRSMLVQVYKEAKDSPKALQVKKKEILERIKSLRYAGDNYLFVLDYNNTMLAHPYIPTGSPMKEVYDIKGQPIVPRIVAVARKDGEGFTHYWWKRNSSDNTPYEKLTYSRDCPRWKMVIATGVYLDDIRKEVRRRKKELFDQLRRIMQQTKIGKTGYIYIFDEQRMIIHPNSNIDGKNFKKLPNPGKGTFIYDDLIKAAKTTGVLHYYWDKPSDKGHYVYEKISWIKYIPSMKIYVVSSAYVKELGDVSHELNREILWFAGIVLLLSLLWSLFYVRKLFAPIKTLSDTASTITGGDYTKRARIEGNDEIGELAKSFNLTVDRLEEQIAHLDEMVKTKTEELRRLAITDALTGLYNRRYFAEFSVEMFLLGKRHDEPLSVIMLDIDHFKQINDTYGHQVGDKVIEKLSEIIRGVIRQSDLPCRYGGEEFLLLLPSTKIDGARELAERLRERIEMQKIVLEDGRQISFTISLGISEVIYSEDRDIEEVIRRADDAMYLAKREGRNRIRQL